MRRSHKTIWSNRAAIGIVANMDMMKALAMRSSVTYGDGEPEAKSGFTVVVSEVDVLAADKAEELALKLHMSLLQIGIHKHLGL